MKKKIQKLSRANDSQSVKIEALRKENKELRDDINVLISDEKSDQEKVFLIKNRYQIMNKMEADMEKQIWSGIRSPLIQSTANQVMTSSKGFMDILQEKENDSSLKVITDEEFFRWREKAEETLRKS